MAADPALAIRSAFLTAARTTSLKTYDEVPPNPTWPHGVLGPIQVIPDEDDYDAEATVGLSTGSETHLQFDIWSKDMSHVETATKASEIREALRGGLAIEGHRLILHEHRDTLLLKDPTDLVSHGVMKFRFDTEPGN